MGNLSDAPVALNRFLKDASPGIRREMDGWLDACQKVSKHLSIVQSEGLAMMGQIKHVHVYAQGLEKKVQSLEKARVETEKKGGHDHLESNKILQNILADKEQELQDVKEELRLLKEKPMAASCKVEPTISVHPSEIQISQKVL